MPARPPTSFGNTATVSPGTPGNYGYFGSTLLKGQVIYADSTGPGSPPTGPQLLYQAIGSANLRPFIDGQDSFRGGVSN
jgi:hypothetical protein